METFFTKLGKLIHMFADSKAISNGLANPPTNLIAAPPYRVYCNGFKNV